MKRRKRQSLPQEPVEALIDNLSHDGRGIARIEGKTTFIAGALPRETIRFKYTRSKPDFDEGQTLEVLSASSQRVEPRCPHFDLCGGCSMQHLSSEFQIHEKQKQLLELLERFAHVQPELVLEALTSEAWNYRNKARLSARYVAKKQSVLVGFREKNNPRYITQIEQCPVLHRQVDAAIPALCQLLTHFSSPEIIAQVEVSAGDETVGLIFRNLSELTTQDLQLLQQFGQAHDFYIYLQPGSPDTVRLFYPEGQDGFLSYAHPDHDITLRFYPTDFTQVNAEINRQMVSNTIKLLDLKPRDTVLDLFCGLGNFSLPMARYSGHVIGVEGSETMARRAEGNAVLNNLTNTEFYSADLDKPDSLSKLLKSSINKLLLDPPRSGALEIVQNMDKLNPERIVYVSCNPATLARDTEYLVHTHGYQLKAAGVMDMFPQTAHVESIALFQRE